MSPKGGGEGGCGVSGNENSCAPHVTWHGDQINFADLTPYLTYTVKRVDEVVRHPHLVTQDQFTQVSKKVSDIPEENFTINIELFRQTFTNVELLR
jgi:hypothetical protein